MSPTCRSRSGRFVARLAVVVLVFACSGRFSGSHPGAGGGDAPLPPVEDDSADEPGLVSVVAGADTLQITWSTGSDAPLGPSLALFGSTAAASVYAGAPVVAPLSGTTLSFSGLPAGLAAWFGLGISTDGGATFAPAGPVLSAVTGPPIFVDGTALAQGADGLTPATAFPTPLQGLLTAYLQGGGNVWIASGTYPDSALPVLAGTRVFGGFTPGFATTTPDPVAHPTVLRGMAGQPILDVQGGEPAAVLDGLVLDGAGVASSGLDSVDTRLECRRLVVRDCAGRGLKLKGPEAGDPSAAVCVGCVFTGHGAEGLSGQGGLSLQLFDCAVSSNQQEGLDLDDLVAADGRTARFHARDCLFSGNGTEGVDCDLSAPLFGGSQGGLFDVRIENCSFVGNGASGLLLDVEHEGVPGWRSELLVRGCVARANAGDGAHLDLDAETSAYVHRFLSTCNGGDGLRVTSDATAVLATLSTSVLLNNGGYGLHAHEGQASVLLSHVIVAGNAAGGLLSELTTAGVVSSVAWRQDTPWSGGLLHHVATEDDPLQPVFTNAPVGFGSAVSVQGGTLGLGPGSLVAVAGGVLELSDDGVARVVTLATGTTAVIDPPPTAPPLLPARLAEFGTGAGATPVEEDWEIVAGSGADDAGMTAPGAPPIDAGILSAPLGGDPGFESLPVPPLFRVDAIDPAPGAPLAPTALVSLSFSVGELDPVSVSAATVRVVDAAGTPLATTASVEAGVLVVAPPAGGWAPPAATLVLEVHAGLTALDGTPLATPLAVPLSVAP